MAIPPILIETPVYHINLTVWLSVVTVCLTAMGTLIKIFARKRSIEEMPGKSVHCKTSQDNINRIENLSNENYENNETLKEKVNTIERQMAVMETESENTKNSLNETKTNIKELTSKLEDLLRQITTWVSR